MKAKVLKSFHQFEEGKVYEFTEKNYNALLAKGYVEKAKATRKKKEVKEEE